MSLYHESLETGLCSPGDLFHMFLFVLMPLIFLSIRTVTTTTCCPLQQPLWDHLETKLSELLDTCHRYCVFACYSQRTQFCSDTKTLSAKQLSRVAKNCTQEYLLNNRAQVKVKSILLNNYWTKSK